MITHPAFMVQAWSIRETALHLDILAQTESLFALSNGHIGLRGNFDEGEPHGLPGTYLNSVHELRPLVFDNVITAHPHIDIGGEIPKVIFFDKIKRLFYSHFHILRGGQQCL